ncbi:MAG: MarR family transcriptional regulator [Gemmataceae bacterium]|nr:MarR family transcriptional regulator [Gemmataceae bacterium]
MLPGKLQKQIKKRHPFASPMEEALLNLVRTTDRIQIRFERLFRQHGLDSSSQYNVLRILRGEGKPLPILEVAGRTLTVTPGITGLIDRLERGALVARRRCTEDRRVVFVSITPQGLELLSRLDEPLQALHAEALGHLSRAELESLSRLLEKARQPSEESGEQG